jgi:hypothetical protein
MRRLIAWVPWALAITVWAMVPACWLADWGAFVEAFDSHSADPLHVADLRILAVAATPSKVFVDPRVIYADERELRAIDGDHKTL